MEPIDKKYLAGLKWRSSKPVKDGEGKVTNQPVERNLQPADVLDWKDQGATVVIVTSDGRKHQVEKKAAEKAA